MGDGDRFEVDIEDGLGFGVDESVVESIDQRLHQGPTLDAIHVDVVDTVPEVDLLLLVLLVLDRGHEHGTSIGQQNALLAQPLVSREQHCVQHRLVKQKVPHPLTDYHVHLLHRQLDLLHLPLYHRYPIFVPILLYYLPKQNILHKILSFL